jgi:hypothetical protein
LQVFTGRLSRTKPPDQSSESVPAAAKKWNCQKYQVVRSAKKGQRELSLRARLSAMPPMLQSLRFLEPPNQFTWPRPAAISAGPEGRAHRGLDRYVRRFDRSLLRGLNPLVLLTGDSIFQSARMTQFKHP